MAIGCGELLVDSTLCSDYVLFMHWLGEVDDTLQERCVRHILKRQLPDGGWNIYYGGPSEINASVKAYFALKLAGHSPDVPFMQEARANILRLGGIPRMNTFSKLYLALLGQFPWQYLPTIPVEMILLPNWSPFNIYKMSSWSRAMLIPLAIINHFKPTRELPGMKQLHELYPLGTEHKDFTSAARSAFLDLAEFFPACRSRSQIDLEAWMAAAAQPRTGRSGALDARADRRRQRWSGRGFSGDAQCLDRAARARLFRERIRSTKRRRRISPGSSSTTRRISAFSPASRRSGTRRSMSSRSAESGLPAEHPALQKAARLAGRRKKSDSAAIGR